MGCVLTIPEKENETKYEQSQENLLEQVEQRLSSCDILNNLQEIYFSDDKEMGFFVKGMSPITLSNGDLDEIVGCQKSILKDSTKEDNSSKEFLENKSSRKVKFQKLQDCKNFKNKKYNSKKQNVKRSSTVTMQMLENIF